MGVEAGTATATLDRRFDDGAPRSSPTYQVFAIL